MFAEFFLSSVKSTTAIAWVGLVLIVAYSIFMASIKARINGFYTDFYDLMQESGNIESGSGSGESSLVNYRDRVSEQLWRFAWIVSPLVFASPASKWLRSAWSFTWRAALMHSYLRNWNVSSEPIEGASQRLHEDTQRFCNALQGCLATLLDAVFTLVVFTPILVELSVEVSPPMDLGALNGVWLWVAALASSVLGLGGATLVGRKLVQLEVVNQKIEAAFRKDLVLLETTSIVCTDGMSSVEPVHRQESYEPWIYFALILFKMKRSYHALFRHFSFLNFWLSIFDQTMVIFPYVVAAPMLFADDPARRITLGTLVKLSNSFDKVFSSMSVIAENWGSVNEFRSVNQRLREFETQLYVNGSKKRESCLLSPRAARLSVAGVESPSHAREWCSPPPSPFRGRTGVETEIEMVREEVDAGADAHAAIVVHTTYGDACPDEPMRV